MPDDFLLLLHLLLRRWWGGIELLIGEGADSLVERGQGAVYNSDVIHELWNNFKE